MKILSNFKDYYDYLVGKYGIDGKIVFNRVKTMSETEKPLGCFPRTDIHLIAFCGTFYPLVVLNKKVYYGDEIKKIIDPKSEWTYPDRYSNPHGRMFYSDSSFTKDSFNKFIELTGQKTTINEEFDSPVVYCDIYQRYSTPKPEPTRIGISLGDFKFSQVMSPEEAYLAISNFLSREKPFSNKQTDIEKVVSHGFDKKSSFRPKIKK